MMNLSCFKFRLACLLPVGVRSALKRCTAFCRTQSTCSLSAQLEDLRNIIVYNHPVSQVPPAEGKLRLLQDGNTILLALFAGKCKEHGLRYWLDYGTLLGAVRHKGFIPWDDDLDVSMMRGEYEELIRLLPQLFPLEEGFIWKEHAFLQIGYEGTPLNIDIYPYHFYSESLDDSEKHASLDVRMDQFKKSVVFIDGQLNMPDEQIQRKIREEILQGQVALPEKDHPGIFLSPAITFTKNTHLSYETFFPLRWMEFEGFQFTAPNHARQYLQFFYGDYMSYPPRVGLKHPSVEHMIRNLAFESSINRFIDQYSPQVRPQQS